MFLHKHFIAGPGEDAESADSEVQDIIRNLNFVLKTKRGTGYFLPTFGLSDVGFRTPAEMITTLTQELTENIRLYEPRVELVDVDEDHDDEGHRVRLVVNMKLRNANDLLQIVVDLKTNTFDVRPAPPRPREE